MNNKAEREKGVKMAKTDYEAVIGLEVHAELSTKTKIFCSCSTEFGADSNTHICPICTAMPGALPKLNEKVVYPGFLLGDCSNPNVLEFVPKPYA